MLPTFAEQRLKQASLGAANPKMMTFGSILGRPKVRNELAEVMEAYLRRKARQLCEGDGKLGPLDQAVAKTTGFHK